MPARRVANAYSGNESSTSVKNTLALISNHHFSIIDDTETRTEKSPNELRAFFCPIFARFSNLSNIGKYFPIAQECANEANKRPTVICKVLRAAMQTPKSARMMQRS